VNNTIAANDSTASSGVLFQTLYSPLASSTSPTTRVTCGANGGQSCPQVSGVVSQENSPVLVANINQTAGTKSCASGHGGSRADCFGSTSGAIPGHSIPLMFNDAIWQNRSFYIGVGGFGPATTGQNQQHLVALFNAPQTANQQATTGIGTAVANQGALGACVAGSTYWEVGYRGDTTATSHAGSGFQAVNSLLSANVYGGSPTNQTGAPGFKQYCNGSRTPPEAGGTGWAVPPGTNEGNASPQPVFNLTPSAVVDEGNNWVNLRWGPLSLYGVDATTASLTSTTPLADYTPTGTSVINKGAANLGNGGSSVAAPTTDFFGNARPQGGGFEIGAIEVSGTGTGGSCGIAVTPTSLTFPAQRGGTTSTSQAVTLTNSCTTRATGGTIAFAGSAFSRATGFGGAAGSCATTGTVTLNAGANCTINVVFSPSTAQNGPLTGSLTIGGFTGTTITGSPVSLSGTAQAPGTLAFTAATNGALTTVFGVRRLTFTIPANRAAVSSDVTVTNQGAGPLTITADSLLLPSTVFSITGTTCLTSSPLAANGTCTITVKYATPATRPNAASTDGVVVNNNGSSAALGVNLLSLSGQ